jgi:hypothetical protein
MDWLHSAQVMDQWQAVMNAIMNPEDIKMLWNFLTR